MRKGILWWWVWFNIIILSNTLFKWGRIIRGCVCMVSMSPQIKCVPAVPLQAAVSTGAILFWRCDFVMCVLCCCCKSFQPTHRRCDFDVCVLCWRCWFCHVCLVLLWFCDFAVCLVLLLFWRCDFVMCVSCCCISFQPTHRRCACVRGPCVHGRGCCKHRRQRCQVRHHRISFCQQDSTAVWGRWVVLGLCVKGKVIKCVCTDFCRR